jgi:type II secretory pathway predicted ATPase ExeA/cell division septation protein DedD
VEPDKDLVDYGALEPFQDEAQPVDRAGSSDSLTYEPFYGLSEKPFSLSADPRFLFKSPAHAPAFDALLAGIRRREGLIVLTGDIGSGKTTLCRSVLQHLDRRTFAAFVPDPFVSREDLLKALLVDFGVVSISDLRGGHLKGASRADLSYPLYEFLDSLVPLQAFAVVIIDEAQNIALPLLEEIRILSELERREKLLQVVLVGQPELRANLKLPQMRQVDQRVSVRHELVPLDADGVAGYVRHRLRVASVGDTRLEFTAKALAAVYEGSSGVPRLINQICDRALQRAYVSQTFGIDSKFVWEAIADLDLTPASGAETTSRESSSTASPAPPVISAPEPLPLVTPFSVTIPRADEAASGLPEFPLETRVMPPAVIIPRIDEGSPRLLEFAVKSEPPDAPPESARLPRPRGRVAAVLFLTIAVSVSGAIWYLRVESANRGGMTTMPPPPPPTLIQPVITPQLPDAPAVSSGLPDDLVAPVASATPAAGSEYLIQVAFFASRQRAATLVAELTTAGYRAREVERDFGPPRGRLWQVIVGGYSSALEVERDLRRIRELPAYSDAHLIAR